MDYFLASTIERRDEDSYEGTVNGQGVEGVGEEV